MKSGNRGELGCALLFLVAILAGIVYVISQVPWLLVVGLLVLILGILVVVVLADVTSDDVLVTSEEQGGFTARRLLLINRLRVLLNKPSMWQVPKLGVTFEERQLVKQASRLTVDIAKTLNNSPASTSARSLIEQQVNDVPANIVSALWRLDRMRRVSRSLDLRAVEGKKRRDEIADLEQQVLNEIHRALDTLSAIPVNLMQVELTQADRPVQRMLADLSEANQQLHELSATYDEMRKGQAQ